MKKILLKLALLGATLFAYQAAKAQTVSVTADLKTMFNAGAATKTQVCFSLTDGNGNQLSNPRTSSGVIVPTATQCVLPDGSGHVSTTVIANDQITPANSIYSVTYTFNGRVVHGDIFQFALADGTENLNSKASLSVLPVVPSPTGDTTYARLDGGNQPFTAPIIAPTINATTGFKVNSSAPLNHFLLGNGTNYVDAVSLPLVAVIPPTGTGYAHITSGVWDAASKLISLTSSTDIAANQGTTTTLLHGNAAGQTAFSSVVTADLNITTTTCTNQFITAISSGAAGTCTTATLASAQFANQGTGTTVLHGNAAGNPSFGSVAPGDTTGTTGSGTTFALSTSPVFTTPSLGVATGTSLNLGATGVLSTTAQSGTGSLCMTTSCALTTPSLSSPSTTGTDSGTETLQNKRLTPRIVTMADATSVTPTSDTADQNIFTSTQAGGTLTVNAPSGTPTDGQKLLLRLKSTNAQTYSFNATYAFSSTTTAPTTLTAGKTDYIGLIWNATNTKWDVVAVDQGH